MLKKQKGISLVILIIIVCVLIISVAAGIIFITGRKSGNNTEKNQKTVFKVKNNSESSIKYINSKGGQNNKLALLLRSGSKIEYVLTIKFDKKMNISEDYLDAIYNNNLNVAIKDDYRFEIDLDDIKIDIDDDDIGGYEEIIKQKDNWYLTRWNDEYTRIYLKIQNPKSSWNVDWVSFDIEDSERNCINEEYFDKLTETVNIYMVSDGETLAFTDLNDNKIDLSEYTFLNDYIAKSLVKYDIYLKKTSEIEMDVMGDEILYNTDDGIYFIEIDDAKDYSESILDKTRIKTFKYNGEEYEIFSSKSDYSGYYINVYKKIDNEKYLSISEFVDDISDVENIVNTITKDIL